MLHDVKRLHMLEVILEAYQDLVIPYSVYAEVSRGAAARELEMAIAKKKIRVVRVASTSDLAWLRGKHGKLNDGELDAILTYERIADDGRSYCVLDDEDARKAAESRDVRFTGTMGLLCAMRDDGVISGGWFDAAIDALRKAGFRLPREIC